MNRMCFLVIGVFAVFLAGCELQITDQPDGCTGGCRPDQCPTGQCQLDQYPLDAEPKPEPRPDDRCPDGRCPRYSLEFRQARYIGLNTEPKGEPGPEQPSVPPMDLPVSLRQQNYSGGSCMHAAMIDVLNWQGLYSLAVRWRKSYAGGCSVDTLAQLADKEGLKYAYTIKGDVKFLEWASRTRRGAAIHYYSNHAVTFCGFQGGDAILINNNSPTKLIRIPKQSFLIQWRGYGGRALTVVYRVPPPRPWRRWRVQSCED